MRHPGKPVHFLSHKKGKINSGSSHRPDPLGTSPSDPTVSLTGCHLALPPHPLPTLPQSSWHHLLEAICPETGVHQGKASGGGSHG